jgi:MFS transporter, DHA1 family, multidrug resistance protein
MHALTLPNSRAPAAGASSMRIVWLLTGSLALMMTGYGIVFPVFARRLAELGAGVEALGLMAVAFAVGQLIAAPGMGALADRIGRRPLILLALASVILANLAYLVAANVAMFVATRFVVGVLSAGLLPAAMAVVGDIVPADERARWSGTLMGGYGVGFIFGPTLGGVLYDSFGFAIPFLVSAALGVVGVGFALAWLPETRPAQAARSQVRTSKPGLAGLGSLPRPLGVLATLLVLDFLSVFLFAFVEPQLAFYLYDNLGFTTISFGLIVGAYGLALVVGQATLGRAADRYGRRLPIAFGLLLLTFFYGGLVVLTDLLPLVVATLIAGVGGALVGPSLSAAYLDITPEAHRSKVMGLKGSAAALGGVAGPLLVAVASVWIPPQGIFAVSTGLAVLAALVALLVLRDRFGPAEEPGIPGVRPKRVILQAQQRPNSVDCLA